MGRSPVRSALDRLIRPLEFAARDDYAHLGRIRDLQPTLARACESVLELGLPADMERDLRALASLAAEELDRDGLQSLVQRSLALVEPCRQAGWEEELLARSVAVLPGIGPKRAEAFARAGLGTVGDLVFYLPLRYDDRRSLVRVGELEVGRRATFIAEVERVETSTHRGRRRFQQVLQAVVGDDSGRVTLKWFQRSDGLRAVLQEGARLLVTGDVKRYRFSKEIVHPEIDRLDEPENDGDGNGGAAEGSPIRDEARLDELRQVVPEYRVPEGVPPRTLRRLVARAVAEYGSLVPGHLPAETVRELGLPEPAVAIRRLHDPHPEIDVEEYVAFESRAHQRLILEELFLLQLGLLLRRRAHARAPGMALDTDCDSVAKLPQRLPFVLTAAQARAWEDIRRDLALPHPMQRLVQGDVGCGKTAVAFLAAAAVAEAGHQSALMAPTELLAEQHLRSLRGLMQAPDAPALRIALLSSSLPRADARAVLAQAAEGELDLVVGTHALVQKDVAFRSLALAIVDEQHRFGVLQRAELSAKGPAELRPHALVLTATPIPRTLALTLYGDLDLSVIDELPPGRSAPETLLLRDGEGQRIVELIRSTADRGEQIYVVYPLVEESEKVDLRSAMRSAERIRASFPDLGVDLVHGRLDAAARQAAMDRFARGDTQILVSTTVIEVGVDVPAATLMIVEHAERFGLAQLHQLRGRVGRGDRPGRCVLVARGGSGDGEARLRAMLETSDGFRIADADLRIRGAGDFLGTRQSGHLPDLRIADLLRDARWIDVARRAADATLREAPELAGRPDLERAVAARWGERLALLDVG